MKRALYFLPLVLFVALLGVLAWFNFHKKAQSEMREMVGKPVPVLALTDLNDGSTTDLKTLAAGSQKPILVNVFASWCVPCVAENPQLVELKARGVTIIGIAWKDKPQDTLNFLAQYQDPYARALTDPSGKMGLELGISGVPETYVVRPDGTIADKITGPIVPDTLEQVYSEVK